VKNLIAPEAAEADDLGAHVRPGEMAEAAGAMITDHGKATVVKVVARAMMGRDKVRGLGMIAARIADVAELLVSRGNKDEMAAAVVIAVEQAAAGAVLKEMIGRLNRSFRGFGCISCRMKKE
jgi:hypothetical protein